MPVRVVELWRYPVKSMGGEKLEASPVGERGLHADRMWAVRDPELGAITTARRRPALLHCHARYPDEPADFPAAPGNAPAVVITLPDGSEVSSADPDVHSRLSAVLGAEVRLEPLPPESDKKAYRAPLPSKTYLRAALGLREDEPIPDLSMFPVRMLGELARYTTPLGTYFDAYPVHVITRASLAEMARRTPSADFDVRRFRPNVVLDTGEEDGLPETRWCGATLEAPAAALYGEIPTIRCVMPTRDQPGLEANPAILRTVAAHADRCLGLYASVARPGRLAVGDDVHVRLPAAPSRPAAAARAGTVALKRRLVRAGNALLPK